MKKWEKAIAEIREKIQQDFEKKLLFGGMDETFPTEDFLKDMEAIFDGPPAKMAMCARCGDTVTPKDGDCSCGYIGEIFKAITKREEQ